VSHVGIAVGGCGVASDSWQTQLNWFARGIVLKAEGGIIEEGMRQEWH